MSETTFLVYFSMRSKWPNQIFYKKVFFLKTMVWSFDCPEKSTRKIITPIVLPIGNPKSLHKLIPLWASPVWIRKSVNNRLCLKSINLQYDMLVRWADGTNDLSTKRLMFQLSFFFVESCKTLCINLSIYFFYKITKMKIFGRRVVCSIGPANQRIIL